MPRSAVDIMWSETLTALTSQRQHREVFRLTETGWEPPIDVLETETGLLVTVALPGVRLNEMQTVVGNGELIVRGVRRWPNIGRPVRVHRIELPHGHFERRLPLPHGAFQFVSQEHTDGCLILTLQRLL